MHVLAFEELFDGVELLYISKGRVVNFYTTLLHALIV
jgi:hypothetical protein